MDGVNPIAGAIQAPSGVAQATVRTGSANQGAQSANSKRRNRKGPRQRAQNQGERWYSEVNHQDSKPSKGTARPDSRAPTAGEFKPGEYPILFDAVTGDTPVFERPMVLNFGSMSVNTSTVYDVLIQTDAMQTFMAHKFQAFGPAARHEFRRTFVSAGTLCAGQQAIKAVQDHDRSIGQTNFLLRSNIEHTRAVRVAGTQYGMFVDRESGEIVTTPNIWQQTMRCVRTAYLAYLGPTDPALAGIGWNNENFAARAAETWWLPIQDEDESFTLLCRDVVRRVTQAIVPWIDVAEDLPILTGVQPPWWAQIPAAQQPNLAPFFVARPAGAVAWLAWVNTLTHVALLQFQPTYAPAKAAAFIAAELRFNFDCRTRAGQIVDKWAGFCKGFEQKIQLMDRTALARGGPLTQLGTVESTPDQITTYSGRTPVTTHAASLYALFPSEPIFWRANVMMRHVRQTAQANLAERRAEWIKRDVK